MEAEVEFSWKPAGGNFVKNRKLSLQTGVTVTGI